jgi:hypothetical protein
MRTEQIGSATLYLGDCRELLPTLSGIDAVVTDPVWPLLRGPLVEWSSFGLGQALRSFPPPQAQ